MPDGSKVWMKREERISGLMRLQKGNPSKAFAQEREGLHLLARLGLAAAPILAEGPDWFVTPDLGPTLRDMLRNPRPDSATAFAAGGTALARLHLASYRHGRPAIRDLCWDGSAVHFIDLERFSCVKSDPRGLALDLIVFAHSIISDGYKAPANTVPSLQDAALNAYRGLAPGIWAQACKTARWLAWVPFLTRLVPSSNEWRAAKPTLDLFRQGPE